MYNLYSIIILVVVVVFILIINNRSKKMEGFRFTNYSGPHLTIFTDDICPNLGEFSGNLDECKNTCDNRGNCTAFNFNPSSNLCYLRECRNNNYPSTTAPQGWSSYTKYPLATITSAPAPAPAPAPAAAAAAPARAPAPAPAAAAAPVPAPVNQISYYGPHSTIFTDNICPNIGEFRGNLDNCKHECNNRIGNCTAFNFNPSLNLCYLRACSNNNNPSTTALLGWSSYTKYPLTTTTSAPASAPAPAPASEAAAAAAAKAEQRTLLQNRINALTRQINEDIAFVENTNNSYRERLARTYNVAPNERLRDRLREQLRNL